MTTISFDFDGVIHSYKSGWLGEDVITDEPVDGIVEVIRTLFNKGYRIQILSSRCRSQKGKSAVIKYLCDHNIPYHTVTSEKEPAVVYVDDRGLTFKGDTSNLVEDIENFKSWTEH